MFVLFYHSKQVVHTARAFSVVLYACKYTTFKHSLNTRCLFSDDQQYTFITTYIMYSLRIVLCDCQVEIRTLLTYLKTFLHSLSSGN